MTGRPSLRQLEYFLAAVEHGSFQPSLSEQIRRLERTLGGRLFVRTNRNLQLTDMGRQLIPLAQNTLRTTASKRPVSGAENWPVTPRWS